jgi:hypothetical protein
MRSAAPRGISAPGSLGSDARPNCGMAWCEAPRRAPRWPASHAPQCPRTRRPACPPRACRARPAAAPGLSRGIRDGAIAPLLPPLTSGGTRGATPRPLVARKGRGPDEAVAAKWEATALLGERKSKRGARNEKLHDYPSEKPEHRISANGKVATALLGGALTAGRAAP